LENNFNIDELIRSGMSDFNPPAPPDSWEMIEQQIQSVPSEVPANSGQGVLHNLKQFGAMSKIGVGLGIAVVVGSLYFVLNQDAKPIPTQNAPVAKEVQPIETQIEEQAKMVLNPERKVEIAKENTNKTEQAISVAAPLEPSKNQASLENKANAGNSDLVQPDKTLPSKTESIDKQKAESNSKDVPMINRNNSSKPDLNHAQVQPEPEFGNVFSPDGNGDNDVWEIRIGRTNYYHLRIFDGKNQLVFETEQANVFWSGLNQKSGMECESGTYSFILDYQYEKSEKVVSKFGILNLIR
jgi:gliding motility-associated-like protein